MSDGSFGPERYEVYCIEKNDVEINQHTMLVVWSRTVVVNVFPVVPHRSGSGPLDRPLEKIVWFVT